MFYNLQKIWDNYGFEIVIGGSVIIILILALYRIGKKGSYSDSYYYNKGQKSSNKNISMSSTKPEPKDSKGETECRRVLQKIFKKPFNKDRPDFLRNPVTGGNFNLELDCFSKEMKLAVEFQGQQHYKYIPFFHRNKEHFLNQKYRDDLKRRLCRDNGIKLIEVSYTVKIPDIENYMIKELRKYGYKV
jgi:hypothetical protein